LYDVLICGCFGEINDDDDDDTQCLVMTVQAAAGQCTSTPRRARATVELYCVKKRQTFLRLTWLPNSPDLGSVDYEIWAVMQHRVYHRQIHSVDELKWRLIDVCCGLEQ